MATPILNIATIAASQNQKEVTANDAFVALENAGNEVTAIAVDDTNAVTITDAQWRGAGTLHLTADTTPPDAAITCTVPAIKRHIVIVNTTGQTVNASISGQSEPAVEIEDGAAFALVSDGTDLRSAGGGGGGAADFVSMTDTPSTYTGQAGKVPKVNVGETALEFATVATAELAVTDDTGTSRTLALADAARYVRMDNASPNTVTVPPNSSVAFAVGAQVHVRQAGAGQTTIAEGAGVTVNTPETLKLRGQHSTATLVKVATDTWDLMGDLEAAP